MQHQTQTTHIFTVFGSYPIGPQADYFPSNTSRPDSPDRRDTTKKGSAARVPELARECQEIRR